MSGSDVDSLNAKHPDSDFVAEYPYNTSTITRSGHEFHVNDTPGSESLRRAHTHGTYEEWGVGGRETRVVVGKAHHYYSDGFSETVDGHRDVRVAGTVHDNVDGSTNRLVKGNSYSSVGGDEVRGTGGSLYEHVEGQRECSVGGDLVHDVTGDRHDNVDGDRVDQVGGSRSDVVAGDWLVASSGNNEVSATGSIRFKCDNFVVDCSTVQLNTPAGTLTIDGSSATLRVSGPVKINGSVIDLN